MKQIKWMKKRWFGYALYGILLTVTLFYLRFPSDALREYLQSTADRVNPDLHLFIERVSLSFPFGLKLIQARLSLKEDPEAVLLKADAISFSPKVLSFLQGDSEYGFVCSAYDGDLKGRIILIKNDPRSSFNTSIALKSLRISDDSPLSRIIRHNMEGVLSGTITYSGKDRFLKDGTGEADLTLSDGWIRFMQPILSLETINFNEILLKINLKNQRLNVTRFELNGDKIRGTASGTIYLRKEFLKSSINLRGNIEPFADFLAELTESIDIIKLFKQGRKGGKLSFNIRGTIKDPRFRFI